MALPRDASGAEFAAVFRQMLPEVRTYARRHGGDLLVDDVASETFTAVWASWARMPDEAGERRAVVFGIARHKLADALAAQARDAQGASRARQQPPVLVADHAEEIAQHDRVTRLVRRLPTKEREAFMLLVWHHLTPAQAASALGCSLTALSTRLSRARRALARLLASEPDLSAEVVMDRAR